ncbi:MAG: 1,4-alpha-glucan branching protein GlgB [Pseudomonadota bacterium]
MEALVRGAHGAPFAVLGRHETPEGRTALRVFAPDAAEVAALDPATGEELARLERVHREGVFSALLPGGRVPYRLRLTAGEAVWEKDDPYAFGPILGELDEYLLAEGRHEDLYRRLGAHPCAHEGVEGVSFAVWAPNARRVSVVGDFNAWDGRRHPMRRRLGGGVWEIFLPGLARGTVYKYEILDAYGHMLPLKADPFSFAQEAPPATGSIVHGLPRHDWRDGDWMAARRAQNLRREPVSVYEVHLGSWRRDERGEPLDYASLADLLAEYCTEMGFTHVELLPITEHPFTGSWGYQPIGLFAPTARHGDPESFAEFVDRLHRAGIGVIVDWVPAHFPADTHGLARFDGTALYEHEDPRLGFHRDWNTLIYNYGRTEVANFLRASALFWLREYHVDALRVDAVASMLYLDYSREEGDWIPNRYGGNENLDAIAFLRDVNSTIHAAGDGAETMAEESTAFPGVSRPVEDGGLGFGFKWNMGWMHDTLEYMQQDPLWRKHHHDQMTFGLVYAFSENFVLPLSHDEVVHGKGSLLTRMPGDRWRQFANLRAYFGFMWTHPGKKLLFMGGEFAQEREWNHDASLDWHLLGDPLHAGVRDVVRDLNRLMREEPALHRLDCSPEGFEWIDAGDVDGNVYVYLRKGADGDRPVAVVCNMAPLARENYRIGLPLEGPWREALNTDAERYGGSGVSLGPTVQATAEPWHGRPASAVLTLPPLATLALVPES